MKKKLLISILMLMVCIGLYAQTTANWYVDNNASGGDGSSWALAYNDLQTVINNGANGDIIFVKKGEFTLSASLTIKEGMEIYGSFTGTETTLAERDLSNFSNDANNATILKSNGNQRVIFINYPPVDPIPNTLDGLVITGGGNVDKGGGIYVNNASPILRNVIIIGNTASGSNGSSNDDGGNGYGGGIYNEGTSSPSLTNVTISGNIAKGGNGGSPNSNPPYSGGDGGGAYGGGMYNGNTSSPSLSNVIFMDNSSSGGLAGTGVVSNGDNGNGHGGGMYNANSSAPSLINVTLGGNMTNGAASYGGGIYNEASTQPKLYNTILLGNVAGSTPGIYNTSSIPDMQYSLLEGEIGGSNGNLDGTAYVDTDIFTDPATGDYTLKNTSPAINTGSNILYTNAGGDLATDIDVAGNLRLYDGTPVVDIIDMGAYELQRNPIAPINPDANNILYVNKNVSSGNESGDSWENSIPELADAMVWANENYDVAWETTPLKIYVAKGIYKPLYSPEDGVSFGTDQGRDNSFSMIKNVQLYGGFNPANGIDDLADARILPSSGNTGSILSGDVNGDDGSDFVHNSENSIRVIVSSGDLGSALLNGFTITGANGENNNNIMVNGNPIYQCSGAGVYNSISSPVYENLLLYGNYNTESGGGMFSYQSSPKVRNSVFRNNKAKDGGAMANQDNSSPVLSNVILIDNEATLNGGAIYNVDNSTPTFVNIAVIGNTDTGGGDGIFNENNANPSLLNSIVWDAITGDFTAQNSLIIGQSDTDNGNIDATGLTETDIFTDPANQDYSLKETSAAVNAGSNLLYTNAGGDIANDVDLAGNPRLFDGILGTGIIDMGAYEYTDDTDPVITSASTASFVENTSDIVYTVIATDTNPLEYSLGNANDEALFNIAASSGEVTFITAPDFENPTDVNTDNAYVINVIANDGINSANQNVIITVTDVDDTDPVFTSATTASFTENSAGSAYTAVATDANAITYSLGSINDEALFEIVASTGEVTFITAPDFENPMDDNTDNDYVINVVAGDGVNSANQEVTITVMDVDEITPVFTSATTASFAENGTGTAYTVVATDANSLTYSLGADSDEALFDIVASTGEVTFKTAPDFENPADANIDNAYVINVMASDGLNSVNQVVTITVTDMDEIKPVATITSLVTTPVNEAFGVTITFTEPVTGFTLEDLTLTNASASNFSGTDDVYQVTISPQQSGSLTISVNAEAAIDAAGNGNIAADFSIEVLINPVLSVAKHFDIELNVYPNPTSDFIRVESNSKIASYQIIDMNGKLLKQIETTENDIMISDLSPGIYFIQAVTNKQTHLVKFIKN